MQLAVVAGCIVVTAHGTVLPTGNDAACKQTLVMVLVTSAVAGVGSTVGQRSGHAVLPDKGVVVVVVHTVNLHIRYRYAANGVSLIGIGGIGTCGIDYRINDKKK